MRASNEVHVDEHGVQSGCAELDYCRAHDIPVVTRLIGQKPARASSLLEEICTRRSLLEIAGSFLEQVWPESLQDARRRFALRFLQYLQRGAVAKCLCSTGHLGPLRMHTAGACGSDRVQPDSECWVGGRRQASA